MPDSARVKEILSRYAQEERRAPYPDLHAHVLALAQADKLLVIDEPVNKDTEMHPLVRWQFRGGIPEAERKALLFRNIFDGKGRKYHIPAVGGGIGANPESDRIGMNVPPLEDIGDAWNRAIDNPVPPVVVESGPVHDI